MLQVRAVLLLEIPARKEASTISEDPEPPEVPNIGQLGVREDVNSSFLEGVPCSCWNYDTTASQ